MTLLYFFSSHHIDRLTMHVNCSSTMYMRKCSRAYYVSSATSSSTLLKTVFSQRCLLSARATRLLARVALPPSVSSIVFVDTIGSTVLATFAADVEVFLGLPRAYLSTSIAKRTSSWLLASTCRPQRVVLCLSRPMQKCISS